MMNKRILYTILISLLLSTQYSRAQSPGEINLRPFISLAGEWHCRLGNIHLPGTIDESHLAPHTTDTTNTGQLTRLHPFVGTMVYTRYVEIPDTLSDKEWRLILERTKPATVWIDGDSIGYAQTILSPQIYSLGKLKPGKHQLRILIDNSPTAVPKGIHGSHAWTDATQTNWNGIIGKFGLEAHDEGVLIENIQIDAQPGKDTATAFFLINSKYDGRGSIYMNGHTRNTNLQFEIPRQQIEIKLQKGVHSYTIKFSVGAKQALWSEFDPAMYRTEFELCVQDKRDYKSVDFGIRKFIASGTQFTINGLKTFLRGKHDACVFPLTGYPPMNKEAWKKQFRISKQYGINHYRFHSWTPPQAAFDAANEEGIYMQVELPYWGQMSKDSVELNNFLMAEGKRILESFGNNPSFVMMALGNELGGNTADMKILVDELRNSDHRRLYAAGSNVNLGTSGQQSGDDFYVTCRVGGTVGTADYSTHSRGSFSFADAKNGGYINGCYPSTDVTFSYAVDHCTVPVISHENGQFQVYPDYSEIKKYTGVLYPYNMQIFRDRLKVNHLEKQAISFHKATGKFAAICYKADIEMCLRTPGFGGFQLLDLQDYPGQGSAYVGMLDAFMDSKGAITPEAFNSFCNSVVPLSVMPKYCWYNDEDFYSTIKVFNYAANSISEKLEWSIARADDKTIIDSGTLNVVAPQGTLTLAGTIKASFGKINHPSQLRLALHLGAYQNQYDLWVYPRTHADAKRELIETSSLDSALRFLAKGEKVLFTPNFDNIKENSVGGLFTPDYWNYAMFKGISEWLKRDVSPGTLSILTNPEHPLFKNFPTESHSNWQWWIISRNSRPLILDKTPADFKPLVQVIDNIDRNHKLGLLFEMRVGSGKLFVSMCRLENILAKPEGEAFKNAIISYMKSRDFNPRFSFTPEVLIKLFTQPVEKQEIKGVKNITTYQ